MSTTTSDFRNENKQLAKLKFENVSKDDYVD